MAEVSWRTRRKGYWLFKQDKVKKELETQKRVHFIVFGDEGEHSVIFDKLRHTYTCDCGFYSLKFKDCSHIIAVKMFQGD